MTAKRQAYVPARFLKLYRGQAAVLAVGKPEFEVVRELTEADLVHLFRAERRRVPAICELLMCLAADPEFHKDRLADYQERFNDLWIPRCCGGVCLARLAAVTADRLANAGYSPRRLLTPVRLRKTRTKETSCRPIQRLVTCPPSYV